MGSRWKIRLSTPENPRVRSSILRGGTTPFFEASLAFGGFFGVSGTTIWKNPILNPKKPIFRVGDRVKTSVVTGSGS